MNALYPTPEDDTLDLGALPRSLGFMLRLAQISSFAHFFREFADCDVKPGEFTVIWVIGLNPGVKQGALARTLHIKPAHMTKLVQRMVRDGLVLRQIPPEDRRSVRLSLTPAGETHLNRHRAKFMAVHSAERIGLTETEAAQLLALLNKLTLQEAPECL
ncbi:MAG: MarR family transcriptional regulator [Rhodobacter sp.]|uniref:MarR family winged helix-turn-helix transcriptional regulator n=1 Tax=Pararhodobacter sp. TaxID=2127056 RepID=UPI001DC0129B|nr:MarR family transcriptional regulator [Pararhodobacter sp.]MCB1345824.1 MarR family transcriptional regulator [Paracoccaceae bacterium]MCC0074379.1 MarR family transcriptional regulator [Rhodobacter sp.]HPD91243.1 MarR family transcriptional regulator [Pararhodobacter sp.]